MGSRVGDVHRSLLIGGWRRVRCVVGNPGAVEPVRDAAGQVDAGDWGGGEVGGVQDGQVAGVPVGLVDEGQQPAGAVGSVVGRDVHRLAGDLAGGEFVAGGGAGVQVVADDGG